MRSNMRRMNSVRKERSKCDEEEVKSSWKEYFSGLNFEDEGEAERSCLGIRKSGSEGRNVNEGEVVKTLKKMEWEIYRAMWDCS